MASVIPQSQVPAGKLCGEIVNTCHCQTYSTGMYLEPQVPRRDRQQGWLSSSLGRDHVEWVHPSSSMQAPVRQSPGKALPGWMPRLGKPNRMNAFIHGSNAAHTHTCGGLGLVGFGCAATTGCFARRHGCTLTNEKRCTWIARNSSLVGAGFARSSAISLTVWLSLLPWFISHLLIQHDGRC
jgi:hypothetical protein